MLFNRLVSQSFATAKSDDYRVCSVFTEKDERLRYYSCA